MKRNLCSTNAPSKGVQRAKPHGTTLNSELVELILPVHEAMGGGNLNETIRKLLYVSLSVFKEHDVQTFNKLVFDAYKQFA